MATKTVKTQSSIRNSKLLSLASKSKQEFVKEYKKFDVKGKSSLYFKILNEIEPSIARGNLDLYKKLNNMIKYIREIDGEEFVKSMHSDTNNTLKNTNMVILACKYNQEFVLNYVFEIKLSNDISPQNTDESSHNAFYYAIRSNSTKILDKLISQWPGNYFEDNPQALDDVLSQAYEELKLKNVALSDEMEFLVESKLINLRFFSDTQKRKKTVAVDIRTLKERVELVIDNIWLLRSEYSSTEKVDEKFFFIAKFIAQNIHVLKRQLRSTYDKLPWEEIEFCLVCYIHSHTKQQEINLFTRATLSKGKILNYLQLFAHNLQRENNAIWKGTSIEGLSDLPFMNREKAIAGIVSVCPQFKELYSDYHTLRDIYSLQKINDYIKLALSANPSEKEGQLVITRVLQVIGEYFKNTLESPKLSAITSDHLLLLLPKNTRNVIVDLRNSLSHSFALSKRNDIQEKVDPEFFIGIQNDTKKIGDGIRNILYANKIKTIRMLLKKFVESNTLLELREVNEILGNAKLDLSMPVNFVSSEREKLKKLTSELKISITGPTSYEKLLFNQLDKIVESCTGIESELTIIQTFAKGFTSLEVIQNVIKNYNIDSNVIKCIKFYANRTLKDLAPQIESVNLKKIAELTMNIFNSVRSRGQVLIIDEVSRVAWKIFHLAELGTDDIKLIQDLRDMLTKQRPLEGFKKQKITYKKVKEENYNSQLDRKFCELKDVMKNNGLTGDAMNYISSYKNNKKLQAAVEMLILDIMSILGTSRNCFENNLFFLDNSTPLLTGKSLRNHLAHDNSLVDILLPDPTVAIILNAKKLSSENIVEINKKMGKLVKDEPSKLKERYSSNMNTIMIQEKLFSALEEGKCEDVFSFIRDGADLNARSVDLGWSCLHFASKGPSIECVKFLLDHNLDNNSKDVNGQTPLHIAATHGRADIVQLFVKDYKVGTDEKDNDFKTALHLAARYGHNDVVELLLKNEANIRILDKTGLPALNYAIINKHDETAKTLWIKDSSVESKGGFTPLHQAADVGSSEIVRFLLENGVNVNSQNDNNYTPLHAAAYHGHKEVVEILVSKGANVNAKLLNGSTALHYAVEKGYEEITNILLNSGADVNAVDKTYFNTALHYAAIDGYEEIIKTLLHNKADYNALNAQNITPLHCAVRHGHYTSSILLLVVGANFNARDNSGCTPLDIAVQIGHSNIVDLLLNIRVKRSSIIDMLKDRTESTFHFNKLLHIAALNGHAEIADMLIKKGAKVNNNILNGETPLHMAVVNGNIKVIDLLIKNNADVEARTLTDMTPLHIAALAGKIDAVEVLLNNNADVNANAYQDKPIHSAVQGGNKDVLLLLIKSGADVNAVNSAGSTPLYLAVVKNQKEMVRFLIEGGANVNTKINHNSPLFAAVANNDIVIVELLIQNGAIVDTKSNEEILNTETKDPLLFAICAGNRDICEILMKTNVCINVKLSNGATLLHAASQQGDKDIVRDLILKGATIDAKTFDGTTPLCIAVQNGHIDVVEMLITLGANVNFVNDNGTPLHLAAREGHDDITELLLKNGASVNIIDFRNRTPLELAVTFGHLKIAKILLTNIAIDINCKGKEYKKILHLPSVRCNIEMVKFLVDQGFDINAEDSSGSKPIHIAAREGFKDAVQFYLSKGMDINVRDTAKQSLLHYAAMKGHTEILEYLIEHGANVNAIDENSVTPLHIAAKHANTGGIKVLMKNDANFIAIDDSKRKPLDMAQSEEVIKLMNSTENLFQAVKHNKSSNVEKYIRAGAFIDAKRADSGTPLHYAAWKGYDKIVNVLLENGANPNAIICKNGITPLHYAAKFCHPKIVLTLLANGAIYNTLSENCKTPLDLSMDSKISSLLNLIDDCFKHVRDGHIRVVNNLNKIENKDIMKAVMGASNDKNESLIVTAIQSKFPKVEKLKEIFQGDISMQITEASMYLNEGDYPRALTIYKAMFERRKAILGPNNPGTLDIEEYIGRALYPMGSLNESLSKMKYVYKKRKDTLGLNNTDTLRSKHFIALLLHRLERNTESLSFFQDVYEKQTSILGPNHTDTLNTQFDMALVLDRLGKYEEALDNNRMVYEKRKILSGKNCPSTIMALNNIAMVLTNQGKNEESLKIYREVLEKKNKFMGKNHLSTLKTLGNIPAVLFKQEKFDEALQKYRELWEIQKNVLGPNHPESLKTKYCIGNVYFEQGKWVSALKAYRETFDITKALYGPNYSIVLDITEKLRIIKTALSYQDTNIWEVIKHLQEEINMAAQEGDIDTVQSLLKKGADINDKDIDGRTTLHFAVNSRKLDLVYLLLNNGADPTQCTNKGNTPLHTAASKSARRIVEVLLDHVNKDQLNVFINAKTTGSGTTALHVAATNNSLDIVKSLLKRGAVYNTRNNQGKMPLDLATNERVRKIFTLIEDVFAHARNGSNEAIRKLTEVESDTLLAVMSARNDQDKTVLQLSIAKGHKSLVKQLLEMLKSQN